MSDRKDIHVSFVVGKSLISWMLLHNIFSKIIEILSLLFVKCRLIIKPTSKHSPIYLQYACVGVFRGFLNVPREITFFYDIPFKQNISQDLII